MLTKEELQARKAELEQGRDSLVGKLNAQLGAIEECNYWLSVIDSGAGDKPAPATSKGKHDDISPKSGKPRT